MQFAEYRSFDAVGLAGLIASKQVSAHELLDTALAAVGSHRAVNAVVRVMDDLARQSIEDGLPPGPLSGVPFALKDLWTQMAGVVTANGSRLFKDAMATTDSEIVRRFRRAGLVVFAKTNTPELGLSPTTEPVLFGPTHNPWRQGTSAGGSSGGAAAAVAAGILPLAHATDGGGSIRIPASCCGVFGLKPSRGRVTFGPERGEGWAGLSTQHVVSRSVRDSAMALDLISGPMPGDPYSAPDPCRPYLAEASTDPGRLRVGLCTEPPERETVEPVCRSAAETTARRCEELGHHVTEVAWPFPPEALALARTSVAGPYVAVSVDARAAALGRPIGPEDLEPLSAAVIERGRQETATEHVAAVQAMHHVGRALGEQFEHIDVLLTPTLAHSPFPLGTFSTAETTDFLENLRALTAFTSVANVSGQPAMSLPLGQTGDGMPVGSQCIGRYGDESTLLRLAGQLERAHPWFDRVPPLQGDLTQRGAR